MTKESKGKNPLFIMFSFLMENELKKKFEAKCVGIDMTMAQRLRKLIRKDVGSNEVD